MNLLIDLFFFIFTIEDSIAVVNYVNKINDKIHPFESIKSVKWMNENTNPEIKSLVDVFQNEYSSIWYNMYPKDKWIGKPEKYMLKCEEEGEYLNLCGECVGGTTEKDDNFGLDECGICQGLQRCSTNGCKEPSIESLEEEETNCTQILGMKPNFVDISDFSTKTTVNLISSDLKTSDLLCNISFENAIRSVEIKETEMGIVIQFEKIVKEGKIDLMCHTADGIEFRHELLSVNSAKLKPISSDRSFLTYGQESRMIVTVSNLYALTDLICFAKQNGQIVYKYWTNDIQGNSLSSEVFCERIWLPDTTEIDFGVVYSEDAIKSAQTIKVAVNTPSPKLIDSKIKDGQIIVTFDINLPPSKNCSALKDNIHNIGEGAVCEVVANEFRITPGQGSSFKNGDKLTINVLETKTFSTTLKELNDQKSSIEGPSTVCAGEAVQYKISGDTVANWSIGFTGKIKNSATPGNRQRMNLLLWSNMRENQKNWANSRQITINTTLLIEGVDYELKATSKEANMELSKFLTVSKQNKPTVFIKGLRKMDFNTDAIFEAQVLCKDKEDSRLTWKVGEKIVEGKKLYLKKGSFNNKIKSVQVQLLKDQEMLSQDKFDLRIEMEELEPPTYIDQIVVGTGHDVEIPINKQSSDFTYTWSCSTSLGKCTTPGKLSKEVEEVGIIDDSNLHIPRRMLPVGRYEIEIIGTSTNGLTSYKSVQLKIVPGEPPIISLISIKTLNNIEINLRISDIINLCELSIDSLMANNHTYLNLTNIVAMDKIEGTPLNPASKDYCIKIPEKILKFGTKYKFRFNTNCGSLAQSYMVVSIPLKEVVKTGELEVTPLSGSAMKTPFNINLKLPPSQDTIYDYGFIYNESYYYVDKKLDTSATLYSLPGKIKTFARVCQVGKICKLITGPDINVEGNTIALNATKHVLELYKTAIESGMYDIAIGNAKILSESSKPMENQYTEFSDQVDKILADKMEKMDIIFQENESWVDPGYRGFTFIIRPSTSILPSSWLEKDDKMVNDALDLLQSSMKISNMMTTSDESKAKILNFRDKIQSAFKKKSSKIGESEVLKMEPRPRRQTSRTPKTVDGDNNVIEQILQTSFWIMQKSDNETFVLNEKKSVMKRIPDYLMDMCNSIKTSHLHANSKIAELSATKIKNNNGMRQEMRFPECGGVCSNITGQIILSKGFFDKYNSSDGVCIGSAYLPNDFLSDVYNVSSEDSIVRQSGLYMSKIYKYTQSVAIKEVENTTIKPFGIFRILLWSDIQQNSNLKCHTWLNTTGWTHWACKTVKQLSINGKPALECKCPLQGIHAIFKINSVETTSAANIINTVNTTQTSKTIINVTNLVTVATKTTFVTTEIKTNLPETEIQVETTPGNIVKTTAGNQGKTTPGNQAKTTQGNQGKTTPLKESYRYTAAFIINEDFNKTVGDKKEQFENNIKNQLFDIIKLPNETDLGVEEQEDTIKVTLKLKCEDARIPSVVIDMVNVLNKGDLKLKGLDNKELQVPMQSVDLYLSDKRSSSSSSYIIIISCGVFILVISAVAILLSGVFLKWRRELRALNFIQSMENHSRPKYLRLHESSSMEAIEQSLSGSSQQRPGELDSGIVLTVDPNKISSKYQNFDQMTSSA